MADQSQSSQNIEGTVKISTGTISTGSLTNLANIGTLSRLDRQSPKQITSFGTVGTASGSLFGTISAASGAGTIHVLTGLNIVVTSGTPEIMISYGSILTGGSVIVKGAFAVNSGISRNYNPPIDSGTNSEIIYHFVNAGTANIQVQYYRTI